MGAWRGFDWAGQKWLIEVPEGVDPDRDWTPPTGFVPDPAVDPEAASRISILDGRTPELPDGTAYFHEGDVFEAGRVGSHHWLRHAGDGRVAVTDAGFRSIEVSLPMGAATAGFPLTHPLDDILLLHRALSEGAFALRGAAAVLDGEALVVLGDDALDADPSSRGAVWRGWLLLQPRAAGVDVVPLPSTIRSGRTGWAGVRAKLSGLHVTGRGDGPAVLDADEAAAELLRFAFAPIVGDDGADSMLWSASRIAESVPVLCISSPGQDAFAWKGAAGARMAIPAGA